MAPELFVHIYPLKDQSLQEELGVHVYALVAHDRAWLRKPSGPGALTRVYVKPVGSTAYQVPGTAYRRYATKYCV